MTERTWYAIEIAAIIWLCAALVTGCAGLPTPALAGKTNYEVNFSDARPEETITYGMKIKAPAGTKLDGITGMNIGVESDGAWKVNVSQKGNADTTAQGELIQNVSAQQLTALAAFNQQLMQMLAPILGQAIDAIAPLASEAIKAKVREGEIKAGVARDTLDAVTGR